MSGLPSRIIIDKFPESRPGAQLVMSSLNSFDGQNSLETDWTWEYLSS